MKEIAEIIDFASVESSDSTTICHCLGVSAGEITESIQAGATTVEEVGEATGAGSACGGCQCRVQRMLSGMPVECGPCAMCPGCGWIKKLCACAA